MIYRVRIDTGNTAVFRSKGFPQYYGGIRREVLDWLEEKVGPPGRDTWGEMLQHTRMEQGYPTKGWHEFAFKERDHAFLFKLIWG